MRIGILGAGFTGLTASLRLSKNHQITLIEKDEKVGGLAIGFKKPGWDWSLEKAYHHWFTNDDSILNLAKELNFPVIIRRPKTDVYINQKILPFDSPTSLLKFPYLTIPEKIQAGLVLSYLKFTNDYESFETKKALSWVRKNMGKNITDLIWDPLFAGKFGPYKNEISLTWFWARIKKRTPSLAYPNGGFQSFADALLEKIKKQSTNVLLSTSVQKIEKNKDGTIIVSTSKESFEFDKLLITLPSPIFTKITEGLPQDYINKINSIPHLHAQVLVLVLNRPFFKNTYWLNITDKAFPFLVLAEHTNFMDPKHYNGQHLVYIGNYLTPDHPYLKLDQATLLKKFEPFLKKLNPNLDKTLIDSHLFVGPFAQPVVTTNYSKLIPKFQTPLENIFLANLDMVYPWDRGTNYAVEMGEKASNIILKNA